MAIADPQHSHMNELLRCSVCIDVFTDPRTLPCLHTFCFKCIAEWCKDKQPRSKVACPECRQEFNVPDSGTGGLKKNFFIANLLIMAEVKQETKELCEVCVGEEKKVSEMFCLQCEQSYCKSCSNAHARMKISSSHKFVSLEDVQSGVDVNKKFRSTFCEKHCDKQIELYCLDDDVAICLMCCVLDHRSHHCEEIKKVAHNVRTGRWKQDLQTATNKANESITLLNKSLQNVFDQVKNIETKICEEANRRIQMIENRKQKLITELLGLETKHERNIEGLTQEFANAKALLATFANYCDELLTKGSDIDVCREEASLRRRTQELKSVNTAEETLAKLGDIHGDFSSFNVNFVETDNPQLLVTLSEPPTDSDGRPREVIGVTMLANFLYVVYEDYNTIEVFDCNDCFDKVVDIEVEKMKCPSGMVGCSEIQRLFISESVGLSSVIWRVDSKTRVSDVFIRLDYSDASLSLAENRLLMTSRDSLLLYDIHSGVIIKNVPLTEYMEESGVWHAVESTRGSYLVIHEHSDNYTVSEIDSKGQVLRMFQNEEQLVCYNFVLDSIGRLLVADWSSVSVVLLDEHLKHERILFDKKRLDDAPACCLNYNKNYDRLAVGLRNGHVKIFECM